MAGILDIVVERFQALQNAIDSWLDKLPASLEPYADILRSPVELPISVNLPINFRGLTVVAAILLATFIVIVLIATIGLFFPSITTLSKWERKRGDKLYYRQQRKAKAKAFRLYKKEKRNTKEPENLASLDNLDNNNVIIEDSELIIKDCDFLPDKENIVEDINNLDIQDNIIDTNNKEDIKANQMGLFSKKDKKPIATTPVNVVVPKNLRKSRNSDDFDYDELSTSTTKIVEQPPTETIGPYANIKDFSPKEFKRLKKEKDKREKQELKERLRKEKIEKKRVIKDPPIIKSQDEEEIKSSIVKVNPSKKMDAIKPFVPTSSRKNNRFDYLDDLENEPKITINSNANTSILKTNTIDKEDEPKEEIIGDNPTDVAIEEPLIVNDKETTSHVNDSCSNVNDDVDNSNSVNNEREISSQDLANVSSQAEAEVIKENIIEDTAIDNNIKQSEANIKESVNIDSITEDITTESQDVDNANSEDYIPAQSINNAVEEHLENKDNVIEIEETNSILDDKIDQKSNASENIDKPISATIPQQDVPPSPKKSIEEDEEDLSSFFSSHNDAEEEEEEEYLPPMTSVRSLGDDELDFDEDDHDLSVAQDAIEDTDSTNQSDNNATEQQDAVQDNAVLEDDIYIPTSYTPLDDDELGIEDFEIVDVEDKSTSYNDIADEEAELETLIEEQTDQADSPLPYNTLDDDEISDIDNYITQEESIPKAYNALDDDEIGDIDSYVQPDEEANPEAYNALDDDEIGDIDSYVQPNEDKDIEAINNELELNKNIPQGTSEEQSEDNQVIEEDIANSNDDSSEIFNNTLNEKSQTESTLINNETTAKPSSNDDVIVQDTYKIVEDNISHSTTTACNTNGQFEIISSNDYYRFVLMNDTAQAIFTSREYKNLTTCMNGAMTFKKNVLTGEFIIEKDKFGCCKFILTCKTNSLVKYIGELFKTQQECVQNIKEVRHFAQIAPIIVR